jgi:ABC-type nitrate/sulfonate/bicarbonate transport system substrate-binding protein
MVAGVSMTAPAVSPKKEWQMAKRFWILVIALLPLLSASQIKAAPATRKIVVAYAAMNARVAPLWVAHDRGFFTKYGIDGETLFVRGAPTLVAAMTSGEISVGYTGGTAVIGAAAGGSDLKLLAALTNRVTYDLVVRPDIKKPEDLRGKIFGVQSIGGTVWMGAILGLEHLGLNPEKDNIKIIVAGDQTVLAQAVANGTIDATVLDGVQSRTLHAAGFPILARLADTNLPILSTGIVARESYIKKNPEIVESVMKAIIEGLAFSLSPNEKPETLKIVRKYLKVDAQSAEEGYKDMLIGFDRKPYPSSKGVMNIVRLMQARNPKVGKIKPEDVINDVILKKLDQSGFIDEMYAKYGGK